MIAAFPAWISIALLTACAATFWFAVSHGEQRGPWLLLQLLVQALMLSSFVANFIAARSIWRISKLAAGGSVVVSWIASWCLYIGQMTIAAVLDGGSHPVGIVIGGLIGFLFVPFAGIATAIAAAKGEAAGFSRRATVCGLSAGAMAVFGLITVIPFSQFPQAEYAVSIVYLSIAGGALIGWWAGIGAAALSQSATPQQGSANGAVG